MTQQHKKAYESPAPTFHVQLTSGRFPVTRDEADILYRLGWIMCMDKNDTVMCAPEALT